MRPLSDYAVPLERDKSSWSPHKGDASESLTIESHGSSVRYSPNPFSKRRIRREISQEKSEIESNILAGTNSASPPHTQEDLSSNQCSILPIRTCTQENTPSKASSIGNKSFNKTEGMDFIKRGSFVKYF